MSTQTETGQEFNLDLDVLYSKIDMKSKSTRRKNRERRESDKIDYLIPAISEASAELRNSDSNLYASLDSTLPSHHTTLYASVGDINSNMNYQTDRTIRTKMNLFRNNTGPIKKIRAPPPAIPPPYRIREEIEDNPQTAPDNITMRRTKSTGSTAAYKINITNEKSGEDEGLVKGNKCLKTLIQNFKQKETPKPGTVPTQALRLPKQANPQTFAVEKRSHSNDSLLTASDSSISPITPFTPLPSVNKQLKSAPSTPIKPMLKKRNQSMPSITKNLKSSPQKPLLQSPTTSPINRKHPLRLPPPPPSQALTLPRTTTKSETTIDTLDGNSSSKMKKSTSIGDYTLLIPLSPEDEAGKRELEEDTPTPPYSNPNSNSNSPTPPLQIDTAYTVLNLEDVEQIKDAAVKSETNSSQLSSISLNKTTLDFQRTSSLPQELDSDKNQSKMKAAPPKKPPRKPQIFHSPTHSDSDYSILSSFDSGLESMAESHVVTSPREDSASRPNLTANSKMMTLPGHGVRTPPPPPSAYRNRAHSHNIANELSTLLKPGEEVKEPAPVDKHKPHCSEGGVFNKVFQISKKFCSKDRSDHPIREVSKPIPVPQSSDKVVGLNPILVFECVAYLRQPKSLREEGIFRVPGDLNQINYFIKQYDYSIKTDIEDELDPNTIASVLKNHIRDKGGFVSKKEAAGLFDASRQKNIEEISNIVAILPKEFQKMMKEVFFLFKEVTQHEKENKMSAGTIATSCGLSIFPILNAGNANLMLKCMIDNAEEIFPE